MLTVLVLAVLWLIVVVPMIVRRHDERANERSVERFGTSMHALGRYPVALTRPPASRSRGRPVRGAAGSRAEVFVIGTRPAALAPTMRRPVPVAEEALMYAIDRLEMSPARAQMMARRRRSLTVLGLGAAVSFLLALVVGGPMWVPALLFAAGLGGYVYFLRGQVLRDRERREARQVRAAARAPAGYDITDGVEPAGASDVRIDDDDFALHDQDTVDLTGLYDEEAFAEPPVERRAS
jgi:hypothetical protein